METGKEKHLQVAYEKDDSFNAFIRRVSALPFVKSTDLDPAFNIFRRRAENKSYGTHNET